MRIGRALRVGLAGLVAALIAMSVTDPRSGAEPPLRGQGRIAFTVGESGADRPAQLAVVDANGNYERELPPFEVGNVSWSPDGRSIAYDSVYVTGGIWMTNVDSRRRGRLVVRHGFSPDWSPDGRSIAFDRGRDIWVVHLRDRRQRRVVRDGRSPRWSPTGRKLAFERDRGRRCFRSQDCLAGARADVWVLDLAAKKERRLVRNGDAADWSPGGRQIAFQRCRRVRGEVDLECFIYVMRSDGSAQRRLFKGRAPVWSPNGGWLAFYGEESVPMWCRSKRRLRRCGGGTVVGIFRSRLDGSGRRLLAQTFNCGCPAWGPPPRHRS
jgi:Tol biopolymer transport system component